MNQQEQYNKDIAEYGPEAWQLWLWRTSNTTDAWAPCKNPPGWYFSREYRRHRHADLMITARKNPALKWEFDVLCDGNFVGCEPQWAENKTYRLAKQGHPHAALMAEYAKDAAETDRPWERWENTYANEWIPMTSHPTWQPSRQFRRKPEAAYTGPISTNATYYLANPVSSGWYSTYLANPVSSGGYSTLYPGEVNIKMHQARGLVFLTPQGAIAHAKAMVCSTEK